MLLLMMRSFCLSNHCEKKRREEKNECNLCAHFVYFVYHFGNKHTMHPALGNVCLRKNWSVIISNS